MPVSYIAAALAARSSVFCEDDMVKVFGVEQEVIRRAQPILIIGLAKVLGAMIGYDSVLLVANTGSAWFLCLDCEEKCVKLSGGEVVERLRVLYKFVLARPPR